MRAGKSADGYTLLHAKSRKTSRADQKDGFKDKFWNIGQLVLWAATRKRDNVRMASDDNGALFDNARESELYGLAAAGAILEHNKIPINEIKTAIEDIHRHCRDGELHATSEEVAVSQREWKSWEIVIDDDYIPIVSPRNSNTTCRAPLDLRFPKAEALRLFPPRDAQDADGFWELPVQEPRARQPKVLAAWKALKFRYSNGQIPKESLQQLANIATKASKEMGSPSVIGRDQVRRALGLRD